MTNEAGRKERVQEEIKKSRDGWIKVGVKKRVKKLMELAG